MIALNGVFMEELELATKPPKVRLVYDEIREFQSINILHKKINHSWAIKLLSHPSIGDWLNEHGKNNQLNKLSFCNAITLACITYLTKTPKRCTQTQILSTRKKAKSLKATLPEILPSKVQELDFIGSLDALINFSPSTLPATATKKGNPAQRALIQDIAINIYDALLVIPSNKVITILVLIPSHSLNGNASRSTERSVRNTYTSDFKDEIVKNKPLRDEIYNKNISHSEQSSSQIINNFKIKSPTLIEHRQPKTDIEKINAAIALLKTAKSSSAIDRSISMLQNEAYELATKYQYIDKGNEINKKAFLFPSLS